MDIHAYIKYYRSKFNSRRFEDLDWVIVTDDFGLPLNDNLGLEIPQFFDADHGRLWPIPVPSEIFCVRRSKDGDVSVSLGITGITSAELSKKIENGVYPPGALETKGASVYSAEQVIRDVLDTTRGNVLVMSTSSFISKDTADAMSLSVRELQEVYGKRVMYLDSRSTSRGQTLLLWHLALYDGDDPIGYAERELIPHLAHRFTEPDLSYAALSGRYGGLAKKFFSTAAAYWKKRERMPYMYLPSDNKLQINPWRAYSFDKMLEVWADDYRETHDDNWVIVEFAGDQGRMMAERLSRRLTYEGAHVTMRAVPATIVVHTGPVVAWHNLARTRR